MTSKYICPWCGSNMMYSVLGQSLTSSHFCDNKDCKAFQMVLPDFLWEDIFAWKQSQKDLEIAANMLKKIDNTRVILRENLYTVGVWGTQKFNSGNIVCVATIDDMRNTIYQLNLHNQKEE